MKKNQEINQIKLLLTFLLALELFKSGFTARLFFLDFFNFNFGDIDLVGRISLN